VLPHQRLDVDGELRPYLGARWPAFDRGLTSGTTMAGQSPEMLAADGSVAPAPAVVAQLGFRVSSSASDWTPRGGFYLELGYFRGGVSSMNADLGTLDGLWWVFGFQYAYYRRSSPWVPELQLGIGSTFVRLSPSAENTELGGDDLEGGGFLAQARLGIGRDLARHLRLDVAVTAYRHAGERLEGSEDPDRWLEIGGAGLVGAVGVNWH
jgi:hypothetical protein